MQPAQSTQTVTPGDDALLDKIYRTCAELKATPPIGRPRVQEKMFQFMRELFKRPDGVAHVYKLLPQLVDAGIFEGGGWQHEDRLLPSLVRGSLLTNGIFPSIEALSELRMLAIAQGDLKSDKINSEDAENFLLEVLALNLDILFDHQTEESRQMAYQYGLGKNLFQFIATKIDLNRLFRTYLLELKALCHQRQIMTLTIRKIVRSGKDLVEKSQSQTSEQDIEEFTTYYNACFTPTQLASDNEDLANYRQKIKKLGKSDLQKEAEAFGKYLSAPGLSSPHLAVFLRSIVTEHPDLVPICLALNEHGRVEFEQNQEFVSNLIKMCIRPSTHEYVYGLSSFLERNLLSRKEVVSGIKKLVELDITPEVSNALIKQRHDTEGMTANSILLVGLISVLGQPLGIGQGTNPTCQAARGISLWSQHDPGYLIDILLSVVRDGQMVIPFNGENLSSKLLLKLSPDRYQDASVDPVSQVLSPHLDVIYSEVLRHSYGKGADGHKWANPALYGRWINIGFESVLDPTQTVVSNYESFVRRFYATHHPEYNDNTPITYANPVGIFVTNTHGDLIGLHAVSIQRVTSDESGVVRVYFFNPNNEGRQNWGQGVQPSVYSNGEKHGESSLPFDHFTSRLYAFHFNPYEEGDGFAVPKDQVDQIIEMANNSWGKSYQWG